MVSPSSRNRRSIRATAPTPEEDWRRSRPNAWDRAISAKALNPMRHALAREMQTDPPWLIGGTTEAPGSGFQACGRLGG
jgi:hypothetical protein